MPYKRISIFPYMISLIIFGGSLYYGYTKYQELNDYQQIISANTELSVNLSDNLAKLETEHSVAAEEAENKSAMKKNAIQEILPDQEQMTNLTRELDNFFATYNASNEPFMLNSLSYGEPITDETLDYSILPFQMDIVSSENNFKRFLEYIESSGSFANEVRLMNIQQITISWAEEQRKENLEDMAGASTTGTTPASSVKMINYSVKAVAYFQKEIKATSDK